MEEAVRRHFDDVASRYDSYKAANSYYYDALKTLFAELLPRRREARILEAGCGTGQILASLDPREGVGVDLSPAMIDEARRNFARRPELLFLVGDAENLGLAGPFDAVVMPDVLEHVERPRSALAEAARLLRPGGRLIVSLINPLWDPILAASERLGLKMPEGEHNWIAAGEVRRLAAESALLEERSGYRLLLPKRLPLLSDWVNERFHEQPGLRRLGCVQFGLFRKL